MKEYLSLLSIVVFMASCQGQSSTINERIVGGPCADCEAVLDYQTLNIQPLSIDTLPGFGSNEPKIKLTGTVYQNDGSTPAANVLLYIYHVDRNGIYQPGNHPIGWEKRHGQHRGWLMTDDAGRYTFYTFRPAPYPAVQEPEHIHIYVKEQNTIPYYIDSYLFESDPTLTDDIKADKENRGGSGIVELEIKNGIWTVTRNITLGLNIPDY